MKKPDHSAIESAPCTLPVRRLTVYKVCNPGRLTKLGLQNLDKEYEKSYESDDCHLAKDDHTYEGWVLEQSQEVI